MSFFVLTHPLVIFVKHITAVTKLIKNAIGFNHKRNRLRY